ncbi:MAG TPA: DUF2024 family protein [Flavobacteriia bacterium]|nr:DUF2024 family protein [Flavobacteriia bacterium]
MVSSPIFIGLLLKITSLLKTDKLTTKECTFCHIESATQSIINEIRHKGFFIIEMENCH